MRRVILLFVLTALPAYALADVVDIVNGVRAESCVEAAADMQPLRRTPQLDDAAQRLAEGATLEKATRAAHYPARLSASIRARTLQTDDDLSRTLAQRFCDILGDTRLTDIGVHEFGAGIWLVLATPFTPQDSLDPAELDHQVLLLINAARRQGHRCGRKTFAATEALQTNDALQSAAQSHAADMATNNFLAHEGTSGSMPGDRAIAAGYVWSSVGENVAAGQTTAEEVVDTWLSSAGHCENLMSADYAETGIAHAISMSSDKGTYWVQIFGRSK